MLFEIIRIDAVAKLSLVEVQQEPASNGILLYLREWPSLVLIPPLLISLFTLPPFPHI